MSAYLVGLDIGGTKAAVRAEPDGDGEIVDVSHASTDWDAEPGDAAAAWIDALVRAALPSDSTVTALAVGAQGFDSASVVADVLAGLRARGYDRVAAVNDAALLLPAAGLSSGIALISGTGAIGVGQDAAGRPLASGGWGWVLGDEAGAAGIVRDATRRALRDHDDSRPDDGLLAALLAAFDVTDAERLARAVNDEPTMANWGPRARAVFAAADAGAPSAVEIVRGAASHLALLVEQLIRRGAVGTDVVAAGSVIAGQPRLAEELRAELAVRAPGHRLRVLTEEPVAGALELARAL
ncbi:BadF/BadG/BcrA/BcrD ATPase family protein [Microbacterium tumbae]